MNDNETNRKRIVGAGGTPGGIGEFLLGSAMAGIGLYLLLSRVQVHTSYFRLWGRETGFGITLIPFLIGVGVLFFHGKSIIGWLLSAGGLLAILAGVIANLDIYFARTSLFDTLVMLVLFVGGLGLIVRSFRPHPPG